ncbi:hypothetical protein SAMN05444920_13315 [Nonomuraea solani]|uniref:Uncharacterized protein n=1 Tax=Nonomuraea solani TaxID=1144553 RepID=A0A1H6F170_9ACTN|nr:hypothetical protein SAMN05444920_13315 [Nonomuraea solani]
MTSHAVGRENGSSAKDAILNVITLFASPSSVPGADAPSRQPQPGPPPKRRLPHRREIAVLFGARSPLLSSDRVPPMLVSRRQAPPEDPGHRTDRARPTSSGCSSKRLIRLGGTISSHFTLLGVHPDRVRPDRGCGGSRGEGDRRVHGRSSSLVRGPEEAGGADLLVARADERPATGVPDPRRVRAHLKPATSGTGGLRLRHALDPEGPQGAGIGDAATLVLPGGRVVAARQGPRSGHHVGRCRRAGRRPCRRRA